MYCRKQYHTTYTVPTYTNLKLSVFPSIVAIAVATIMVVGLLLTSIFLTLLQSQEEQGAGFRKVTCEEMEEELTSKNLIICTR